MKALRHLLEYWAALAASRLLGLLPLKGVHAVARFLGKGAYYLGLSRRMALANLALAFPGKSAAERRAIAREAYAQFAMTLLEIAAMPSLAHGRIASMFEFEGLEILDSLVAQKRGAICVSAHFGNWEWMGAAVAARGYPLSLMIGTQSNPYVDAMFIRLRATQGMRGVRIRDLRETMRALKRGEFMAAVGDQDGDKYGVFVKLFGHTACTHFFWELPAIRTGSALVFGVPERLGPRRHRVAIKLLPDPPAGLSDIQATAFRLQAYNDLLEEAVRKNPEMWLWMHHRWLSQPEQRLHIGSPERARVERGEVTFDTVKQAWIEAATGAVVKMEAWNP